MEYLKIDPKLRRRPRPKRAGWAGRQVFKFLLEVSAEFDLRGRIPPSMQDIEWLVDEWTNGDVRAREVARSTLVEGLASIVAEGLLVPEAGDLVITDWDEFYRPAKSGAERMSDLRGRRNTSDDSSSLVTHVTKPVTCDATPLHSTPHNKEKLVDSNRSRPALAEVVDEFAKTQVIEMPLCDSLADTSILGGYEVLALQGPKQKTQKRPPNPRTVPVRDMLCRVFAEVRGGQYAFDGPKDAKGLSKLLAFGDDAEIERRWRLSLTANGYARCDSIAQLALKWNTHAADRPPVQASDGGRPTTGPYAMKKLVFIPHEDGNG